MKVGTVDSQWFTIELVIKRMFYYLLITAVYHRELDSVRETLQVRIRKLSTVAVDDK